MQLRTIHASIMQVGAVLVGCLAGQFALAQSANPAQVYNPVLQGHISGGYSATSGSTSDYLDGGWLVDGGLTFWPGGGQLGLRADVSYSRHNATGELLAEGQSSTGVPADQGWGNFSSVSGGLVFKPQMYGPAHFYGLAQVGATHVQLRLSQDNLNGAYCGPFFGYCGNGYYDGNTVYDYGTTKLSWNVGLGVEFPNYWGTSWFLEAQYRQVETPQTMSYWPLTVGFRF